MQLSTAVTAVVRTLRAPGDLLPFYLIGAAIPAIVRTVPFLALGVVWLYLEASGRIDAFAERLDGIDEQAPDPEADPEGFATWVSEIGSALEVLVTPGVVVALAGSVLVAILLGVVLQAAVSAGQLSTCFARLRGERGLVAGIAGTRRYWLRFLGLTLLEIVLWITVTVVVGIVVTLGLALGAIDAWLLVIGAPVALLAILAWFVAIIAIRALFAFAPVAIVVDDAGVFGSISASYGFVRRRPAEAVFYFVVALMGLVGVSGLLSWFAILGAASLLSIVSFAVIAPVLDLLKTVLFGGYREAVSLPPPPERTVRGQLRAGIGRGLGEMASFVRATPGTHALVVLLGVGSFWAGWLVAGPFVDVAPASIADRIEGIIPPVAALEFFGNNWSVALMTAFSGVAFGIPALVSIAFNGVFIGAIGRLEIEPVELLAFVAPHGVFEIPAILIAGAVGVVLGVATWRTIRGRASRAALADELERAFWVLVGVGVLLAIAAVIEGFVSPFYWRLFL